MFCCFYLGTCLVKLCDKKILISLQKHKKRLTVALLMRLYPHHVSMENCRAWEKTLLILVLLNPDIPCLCKQCRSRSVGFWRSQLIWICTVCHLVCEFISTIWIKESDWLTIRSGCGILILSAGQGLSQSSEDRIDPDRHFFSHEVWYFSYFPQKTYVFCTH